jgi:hypothetical protein
MRNALEPLEQLHETLARQQADGDAKIGLGTEVRGTEQARRGPESSNAGTKKTAAMGEIS